jgi:CyaY protein
MIDDAQFTIAAGQLFKRVVKAVDAGDPDVVEADSTGDMVTIVASKTGEKVIMNTQRAVRQIWVAGRGAGLHFSYGATGQWLDDKGKGIELMAWVAACVESATGVHLDLK